MVQSAHLKVVELTERILLPEHPCLSSFSRVFSVGNDYTSKKTLQ